MEKYHVNGDLFKHLRIGSNTWLYIKMANLTETNFARKVDSMGRITIPIRLREQVGIELG